MQDWETLAKKKFGTEDGFYEASRIYFDKRNDEEGPSHDKWSKLSLPYFAPDESLPPIPTPEDIEQLRDSKDRFTPHPRINHLFRVHDVYAVKVLPSPRLIHEAENLIFLQEHKVRAPKLYALYSHQGSDPFGITLRPGYTSSTVLPTYYYLVTEFIDGITLESEEWEAAAPEVKQKIFGKLGEQLSLLRSIPAPHPSYYGRIYDQPFEPEFHMTKNLAYDFSGPFYTYEAFLNQMLDTAERSCLIGCRLQGEKEIPPRVKLFLSSFLDGLDPSHKSGEPKLTHKDLNPSNIMLRRNNTSSRIEDWDLWLVDWQTMAWLPAWAEVGMIQFSFLGDRNWAAEWELSKGIQPYYRAQAQFYVAAITSLGGHFG